MTATPGAVPDPPFASPDPLSAPPRRRWRVSSPIALNVVEWGPADGPPLVLTHGGGDFARCFDGLAPRLAAAGWRVVAWDQRGHGDSAAAARYGYQADLRDGAAVLAAVGGGRPVCLIGHSKGAVLSTELTVYRPELVRATVVIDGFTRRISWTGSPVPAAARWLDVRRAGRGFQPRPAEELAARRQETNPRLSLDWCRYLVGVGAEPVAGGPNWRWKLDPAAFPPPPHSWPPEASMALLGQIVRPYLGLKSEIREAMASQPDPALLRSSLAAGAEFEVLEGVGHFAHVEDPDRVAARALAFFELHAA